MVDVVVVEVIDIDDVAVVIRLAAVRIIPKGNIARLPQAAKSNIQKRQHPVLARLRLVGRRNSPSPQTPPLTQERNCVYSV